MENLPRSLRPHDVVVWVRSSAQGNVRRRRTPQGSTTKRGEVDPKTGISSLRPYSQHPTKGARRRRTTGRLSTSPPKLTKRFHEPTGLKTMVCPGRPKKQQRRGPWVDGQTSHEGAKPADNWSTSSPRRGRGKERGWVTPKKRFRGRKRGDHWLVGDDCLKGLGDRSEIRLSHVL